MEKTWSESTTWVFDLDNTLYPAQSGLFSQIDQRMTDYVAQRLDMPKLEAKRLQKGYFHTYGLTMIGLQKHHGVDPQEFMDHVHAIDLSGLPKDQQLVEALQALPGKKFIYTNGCNKHAANILGHLEIDHCFHGSFDIIDAEFNPKPSRVAYEKFLSDHGIDPQNAVMVEDIPRNLEPAAALGLQTVWLRGDPEYSGLESENGTPKEAYIHHTIDDLPQWLSLQAGLKSS